MSSKERTPTHGRSSTQRKPLKSANSRINVQTKPPTDLAAMVQRALPGSRGLSLANVLQLQGVIGNRAAGKLLAGGAPRPVVQPKLTVGAAHDAYEQEADRVAAQVIAAPTATTPMTPRASKVDKVQAKTMAPAVAAPAQSAAGGFEASADFGEQLGAARGGGSPLPGTTRDFMQQRMGADFSGVKVHTDAQSDQLNRSIQAKAFTTGRDVFFREGAFQPASVDGQKLIAHELTHVVQQTGNTIRRFHIEDARSDSGGTAFIAGGAPMEAEEGETPELDFDIHVTSNSAGIQTADDGSVAVQNTTAQPKVFFATQPRVTEFNSALERAGSWYRLNFTPETIKAHDLAGTERALNQVLPINIRTRSGGTAMVTKQLCNQMAAEVTGASSSTELKPQINDTEFGREVNTVGTTTSKGVMIAKRIVEEVDRVAGKIMKPEEVTSDYIAERLKGLNLEELEIAAGITRDLGVNEYTAEPEIGDAYVTVSGDKSPESKGKWNYHWGGVIGKAGSDVVTLENFARQSEGSLNFNPEIGVKRAMDTRYFFRMYGTLKELGEGRAVVRTEDRSYHTAMVETGDFINPMTFLTRLARPPQLAANPEQVRQKIVMAKEYLSGIENALGIGWDLVKKTLHQKGAKKNLLFSNLGKLPLIITRVAEALDDETRELFLEEIKATMPDLTLANSSFFNSKSASKDKNAKLLYDGTMASMVVLRRYVDFKEIIA